MLIFYEITGNYELIDNCYSVMREKLSEAIKVNNLDVQEYSPDGDPKFFTSPYTKFFTSPYSGFIQINNTVELVLLWYLDGFKYRESEIEISYASAHAQELVEFNSWDTVVRLAELEGFEDVQEAMELAIKLDLLFNFHDLDADSESAIF